MTSSKVGPENRFIGGRRTRGLVLSQRSTLEPESLYIDKLRFVSCAYLLIMLLNHYESDSIIEFLFRMFAFSEFVILIASLISFQFLSARTSAACDTEAIIDIFCAAFIPYNYNQINRPAHSLSVCVPHSSPSSKTTIQTNCS